MAAVSSTSPIPFSLSFKKTLLKIIPFSCHHPFIIHDRLSPNSFLNSRRSPLLLAIQKSHFSNVSSSSSSSLEGYLDDIEGDGDISPLMEARPVKFLLLVVFWATFSVVWFATSRNAKAALDSIRASSFGVKVASILRGSSWPDEAVVFLLSMLPVIELRGAIPVGYWMQLNPLLLTLLSIIGNMVPVPLIILYLKKAASSLVEKKDYGSQVIGLLVKRAREKARPVEEFQWLGLMLFVAVPFPGTGAWTGAFIASVLDMPFWPAVSANFCGVVLAALLVNLLVNLGLKYAIVTGILLFFASSFMWTILRKIRASL